MECDQVELVLVEQLLTLVIIVSYYWLLTY